MKVTTVIGEPYVMLRKDPDQTLTGNEQFEGFVVDMLEDLSKILGFHYVLKVNAENKAGNADKDGKWNGMIGDLIEGRADIAAGDMTITSEREGVIDFIPRFMGTGITVLYKKGDTEGSDPASLEDLLEKGVTFGCLEGGSTSNFFSHSNHPTYSKIWSLMSSADPSAFVSSNVKGVERVRGGNYAFFMESSTAEYFIERACDLYQVGGLLDMKGYGLAGPQGSLLQETLKVATMQLRETGRLDELKRKWWHEMKTEVTC